MTKSMLLLPLCLLLGPYQQTPQVAQRTIKSSLVGRNALPVADPVSFLERCLARYDEQGVKGFTCTLLKQERIAGELMPSEEVQVAFRDQPHSVFMNWVRGQRKANRVLYVAGQNDGQMLINPAGLAGKLVKVASRPVDGPDARSAGRYTLDEFGLKKALNRTYTAWKKAQQAGTLQVEYQGIHRLKEIGDRECYKLHRKCQAVEDDGVLEVTIYIDKETWMQVGSVLRGEDGKLVGEYLFRDVQLNPKHSESQFTRAAVAQ